MLIDLGSSHNFLDAKVAKELAVPLTSTKKVMMEVDRGHTLECFQYCENLN